MIEKEINSGTDDGREVVLRYIPTAQEVVSYYVQPEKLPEKDKEPTILEKLLSDDWDTGEDRKSGHKGLKTFCICLALLLLIAGGLFAAWYFGYLGGDDAAMREGLRGLR